MLYEYEVECNAAVGLLYILALFPIHADFSKLGSSHVLKGQNVYTLIFINSSTQNLHHLLLQVLSLGIGLREGY